MTQETTILEAAAELARLNDEYRRIEAEGRAFKDECDRWWDRARQRARQKWAEGEAV